MNPANCNRNRGGYTLVEVLVSGALLLLLSLMMARGFAACSRLELRSQHLRRADELLEEQMVQGSPPAASEQVTLEVGDYGNWNVEINTYKIKEENMEVSFQILRKHNYD